MTDNRKAWTAAGIAGCLIIGFSVIPMVTGKTLDSRTCRPVEGSQPYYIVIGGSEPAHVYQTMICSDGSERDVRLPR